MTKPGIVRGNLLTVIAGYLLAAKGHFVLTTFLAVTIGTALVIASACVVNNFIDKDIDKKMERTKKRALVTGEVTRYSALVFAALLGSLGFTVLTLYTNSVTLVVGVVAYVFYVAIYAVAKRNSYHGTLIGAIPGALPPVAGYVAVMGAFDFGAILLFLIVFFWQMPHFYAIAIYRRKEYEAAGIPVITVARSVAATKRVMMWYILAFTVAAVCLAVSGYAGITYLCVMLLMGVLWFRLGLRGFKTTHSDKWARSMFHFSLIVTLVFSIMISIDNLLI
jgi:protoheme IX farnesyltransferase